MAQRQAWHEVTRDLVAVAMGRQPADLVIRNGRWVNVHSGEIIPSTDALGKLFLLLAMLSLGMLALRPRR